MKATNNNRTSTTQQQQPLHAAVPIPSFPQKSHLTVTDVSFSSYLKPPEEPNRTAPQDHRNVSDDSELSIFDARKYFNDAIPNSSDQTLSSSKRVSPIKDSLNIPSDPSFFPRLSSASSVDGYGTSYRNRSLASSEASWNSNTGLLGSSSDPQREKRRGCRNRIPKWLLIRPKCPCSGKKSVQVKENPNPTKKDIGAPKEKSPPELSSARGLHLPAENHLWVSPETENRHVLVSAPRRPLIDASITTSAGFTFPILTTTSPSLPSSSSSSSPMKMIWTGSRSSPPSPPPPPPTTNASPPLGEVHIPRTSLDTRDSQETRVSSIQAVPKDGHVIQIPACLSSEINTAPSIGAISDDGDELGSDASSDLFEIESISAQSTFPMAHHHRRNDSLDETKPGPGVPAGSSSNDSNVIYKQMASQYQSEANVRRIVTVVPEGSQFGPSTAIIKSLLNAPEFEKFQRIDLGRSGRGGGESDSDRRIGSALLSCRT